MEGIPVLVADAATRESVYKTAQAAYFDELDEDFEVQRPHGTPALYKWLLAEKFRWGVAALDPYVRGGTALTVCGGSGMDAEFLARAGARVITCDISLGAARRAQERARRHDVSFISIVADVERLPFGDRTLDLVYVHDGLHHLEDASAGLREMARVSASAVSVNEPARAALTALAVRLGLAFEREEAGNRIERLRLEDVARVLAGEGFGIVRARRYAMYYRHEPGPVMNALSHPRLFGAIRSCILTLNRLVGRAGNKLTVQALRLR